MKSNSMVLNGMSHGVPINQSGEGFFGDLWSGIKSVGKFIGKNKLLSTVGSMVPIPAVQQAAKIAGAVGLGRKHGYKHKPGPKKGKAKKGKAKKGKAKK